ncbi:MAG TPA: hypothetical protein VMR43_01420, partial [Variovorax sp.]|nr:hypothetical protein [Variovorax sp.]
MTAAEDLTEYRVEQSHDVFLPFEVIDPWIEEARPRDARPCSVSLSDAGRLPVRRLCNRTHTRASRHGARGTRRGPSP